MQSCVIYRCFLRCYFLVHWSIILFHKHDCKEYMTKVTKKTCFIFNEVLDMMPLLPYGQQYYLSLIFFICQRNPPTMEYTVFAVDCNEGMFERIPGEERVPFQMAMANIKDFCARKIIEKPNDCVGIIFYNTVCALTNILVVSKVTWCRTWFVFIVIRN